MAYTTEHLMAADPLLWAHYKRIQLRDGIEFTLNGLPYLVDIIGCKKRVVNCKKGSQMCLTTAYFLDSVHACKYRRYEQNIMYMMPTVTAVERLSKVSFDPVFQYNPWIMSKGDTNTTMCREINGRSIVMVGAQPKKVGDSGTKDTDNLRSIPCDDIKRDEIDLMDSDMVFMSGQRLLRSKHGRISNFGSPTYPNYGIDLLYNESDQSKWQIKCGHCGKYTCLAETFPKSIILVGEHWIRSCIHCHKEIFVNDGQWQPDYPDRREAGFWVSGLLSPLASLDDYMYDYERVEGARMSEFMRSRLGIASTEAESQLSDTLVLSRCGPNMNRIVSSGETVQGVDIGKTMHVVTGIRTGRESYEIINVSRLNGPNELHDLNLKLNVHYSMIDSGPHDFGVKEFQKAEPYTVYLCQYSEQMPGNPIFDRKSGIAKVNRNEWCDKTHITFTENRIKIPRVSGEIEEYARQMTKTAKTIITHPDTGLKRPRWIPLGDDHYFHATLYFLLAASKSSPRTSVDAIVHRPTHSVSTWR